MISQFNQLVCWISLSKMRFIATVFIDDFPIFGKLVRAAAANVFRRAAQDMRRTRTGCGVLGSDIVGRGV